MTTQTCDHKKHGMAVNPFTREIECACGAAMDPTDAALELMETVVAMATAEGGPQALIDALQKIGVTPSPLGGYCGYEQVLYDPASEPDEAVAEPEKT